MTKRVEFRAKLLPVRDRMRVATSQQRFSCHTRPTMNDTSAAERSEWERATRAAFLLVFKLAGGKLAPEYRRGLHLE